MARWASGTFGEKRRRGRGNPAIQVRFSRFRGTVQQGPVQRQGAQIVQSCMTLRDLLPGFWPLAIRVGSGFSVAEITAVDHVSLT